MGTTNRAIADGPRGRSNKSTNDESALPDFSLKVTSFRNILQETVWVVADSCVLGHYRTEAEAKTALDRIVAERAAKEKADGPAP